MKVLPVMGAIAHLEIRRKSGKPIATEDLVAKARNHEPVACRALYDRYRATVNQTAARLALTAADADDLVQDAFALAFDRIHGLRDPSAFGEWVRSIVIRSAAKRLRRHRIARRLGLVEPASPAPSALALSADAPPDVAIELTRVYRSLADLGDSGVALVLHRVEGRTVREIATLLGISEPTVKRRIRQAVTILEGVP